MSRVRVTVTERPGRLCAPRVSNLEHSLAFYVGLLGCEVIWKREEITSQTFRDIVGFPDAVVRGAYVRIPGTDHGLELFEFMKSRGTPADVWTNNPGSTHLGFVVRDHYCPAISRTVSTG